MSLQAAPGSEHGAGGWYLSVWISTLLEREVLISLEGLVSLSWSVPISHTGHWDV